MAETSSNNVMTRRPPDSQDTNDSGRGSLRNYIYINCYAATKYTESHLVTYVLRSSACGWSETCRGIATESSNSKRHSDRLGLIYALNTQYSSFKYLARRGS